MRSMFKTALLTVSIASLLHATTSMADPVHLSVLSGDVVLGQLTDGGAITAISGDIRIEESHAPLQISAVSGDVKIGRVTSDSTVSAVSGNVDIAETYKSLQVDTVSGDIRIDRIFGNANLKTVSGNADIALSGSEGDQPLSHNIYLKTVSGDSLLHLPKSFSGTIDIWARQREDEHQLPVTQSLNLTVEMGPWEDNGSVAGLTGTTRSREIHVSGHVGTGTEHITVHTTTGTVRLVQN